MVERMSREKEALEAEIERIQAQWEEEVKRSDAMKK